MERKLLTFIAVLALAACTPPPEDPPEDPPESTPTETEPAESEPEPTEEPAEPEPTEEPDPSAITLPACEGLLGPEDLELYFFESTDSVEVLTPLPNWGPPAEHPADPAVQAALAQATDIESCTWGYPSSDAFFTVVMAAVSPDVADQARSALSSDGAPTVQPPLIGFVTEQQDSGSVAVYRIEDDAIFAFQGGMGSMNADDAQRHGFAQILETVSEATSR